MSDTFYRLQDQLEKLLNEDRTITRCRERYLFDILTSPFGDSLVLFGAGGLGKKTLSGLRRSGIEPRAFADNNSEMWGKMVEGVPVLSPSEAARIYGHNSTFVVTIWRAGGGHRFAQTRNMLLHLNCLRVVSFGHLFWKYPDIFLPYYSIDVPSRLYSQTEEIKRVFSLWNDEESRLEYLAQLRLRLCLDFDGLPSPIANRQYFADDLFKLSDDEVFIDCGAFDGDTINNLLDLVPAFKGTIIALEPDPANLRSLNSYVASLSEQLRSGVNIHALAAGARRQTVYFDATASAASGIDPAGSIQVDCAPLDEIVGGAVPTFIKMDIEGAELDALSGARGVIERYSPILAISAYHKPDHLWNVPLLIDSMSHEYRFYLRPHNEEGWDLVCYAIPVMRLTSALNESDSDSRQRDMAS